MCRRAARRQSAIRVPVFAVRHPGQPTAWRLNRPDKAGLLAVVATAFALAARHGKRWRLH